MKDNVHTTGECDGLHQCEHEPVLTTADFAYKVTASKDTRHHKDDAHGGKGDLGASARCVDCHLPHDSLVNYIFTKAKNGVAEVGIHFFGNPDEIDWQEKLKHREAYVYDGGCLSCHGNVMDDTLSSASKQAQKMHMHYKKLKDTEKEVGCASCHFDAGHKNMRSYLNYYKPEHDLYNEKMEEKKLEAQKKYEKFGIEVEEAHEPKEAHK